MLSYTGLATEDVPLWVQMFNIISKETSAKASIQNGQENNIEVTDRNMQEGRPETQPTNQPLPVETANQQQMEIDKLCDVADQGMYKRAHQSPSSMGRLMRPCSMPNISPVQQRMRNR